MAVIELILTREDVQKEIPYHFICQTRYGSVWNTMRRKLKWNHRFKDSEKTDVEKLFRQAHSWFINGVPDTVRMSFATYCLWNEIYKFCTTL